MRYTRQVYFARQAIWMSFLTCIPAAPIFGGAALLMGVSLQAALTTYLAVTLIPAIVVLTSIAAVLAREQLGWQSGRPQLRHRIGCGHPDTWGRAK